MDYSFSSGQDGIILLNKNTASYDDRHEEKGMCFSNLRVKTGEKLEFSVLLKKSVFSDPPFPNDPNSRYPRGKFHCGDQLTVGLIGNMESSHRRNMDFPLFMEDEFQDDSLLLDLAYGGGEFMICGLKFLDNKVYMEENRKNFKKLSTYVPSFEKDQDIRHYRISLEKEGSYCFEVAGNESQLVKIPFPKGAVKKNMIYRVILNFTEPDVVSILPFQYSEKRRVAKKKRIRNFKNCAACGKRGNDLKVCARCKSVHYCGLKCQRECWRNHKKDCSRIAEMKKREKDKNKK